MVVGIPTPVRRGSGEVCEACGDTVAEMPPRAKALTEFSTEFSAVSMASMAPSSSSDLDILGVAFRFGHQRQASGRERAAQRRRGRNSADFLANRRRKRQNAAGQQRPVEREKRTQPPQRRSTTKTRGRGVAGWRILQPRKTVLRQPLWPPSLREEKLLATPFFRVQPKRHVSLWPILLRFAHTSALCAYFCVGPD